MECRKRNGQVVIPIFYHIDPSVVRRQEGSFGKALEVNTRKIHSEEDREKLLGRWMCELTQASNISGWDITAFR